MKRTRNFNLVKVMLFAALAAGLSTGLASAQNVIRGKFTLPFEARWGADVLLAGDYTFEFNVAKRPCIVTVRQGDRSMALAMANSVERGATSGHSALVTVRTGGKYQIWTLHLAEAGLDLDYRPLRAERPILAQDPVLIRRVPVLMASK
ncbi:MAG: hypothetical protein ABSF45_29245 [Terriglobia bacterium]|jgi:hypothetical protein